MDPIDGAAPEHFSESPRQDVSRYAPVCRALLALGRAGAEGVLAIQVGVVPTEVWIRAGTVLSVEPGPLSAVLVRRGSISLEFSRGPVEIRGAGVPVADVVVDALRVQLDQHPTAELRQRAGDGSWRLTEVGQSLVAGVLLSPAETILAQMMQSPRPMDELRAGVWSAEAADRFVVMLQLLRCVASPESGSYQLLLKKRRQLSLRRPVSELLELGTSECTNTRHALRDIVRQIHPDRFRASARQPVVRLSGEVVSALIKAEALLRVG